MKCLVFILCAVLLTACNNSVQKEKYGERWNMSDSPSTMILKEKIDSISFIALDDNNSDALFKGIDKVLYVDGRYYVLDYMGTSSVFVFDKKGGFLFKVGNMGEGVGEYSKVSDFDVNNGHIYLLDSGKRTIFAYDMDGKFIKNYSYLGKIEGVNDLIVTDDGAFLLGMDVELNSKDQVILTDTDFSTPKSILSFDEETTRNHLNVGCFRRCGSEIVYYHPISDTFYVFDLNGKIDKTYHLLLADEVPVDVRKDYKNISKGRREGRKYSYFNATPLICNDLLVATAFYNSNKAVIVADLDKKEYALKEYNPGNMSFSLYEFNFPVYLDENKVICQLDGRLYDFLDKEFQSLLSEDQTNYLKRGGVLFVVYHLKHT